MPGSSASAAATSAGSTGFRPAAASSLSTAAHAAATSAAGCCAPVLLPAWEKPSPPTCSSVDEEPRRWPPPPPRPLARPLPPPRAPDSDAAEGRARARSGWVSCRRGRTPDRGQGRAGVVCQASPAPRRWRAGPRPGAGAAACRDAGQRRPHLRAGLRRFLPVCASRGAYVAREDHDAGMSALEQWERTTKISAKPVCVAGPAYEWLGRRAGHILCDRT